MTKGELLGLMRNPDTLRDYPYLAVEARLIEVHKFDEAELDLIAKHVRRKIAAKKAQA